MVALPPIEVVRSSFALHIGRGGGPLEPDEYALLASQLQYRRKIHQRGKEAWVTGEYKPCVTELVRVYEFDPAGRMVCPRGFLDRIERTYRDAGYRVHVHDQGPSPLQASLLPRWRGAALFMPSDDILGNIRDSAPDIGAFETIATDAVFANGFE